MNNIHVTQDIQLKISQIMSYFGYDPSAKPSLEETPRRVYETLKELLTPIEFNMTTFDSEGYSQMIIEKNVSFMSLCEHHLMPFMGTAIIAYIPDKSIIGLSKMARLVEYHSKGLNTQEYMTEKICQQLQDKLQPQGCGVILKARHTCQIYRGVKKEGEMITSSLRGNFMNEKTRQEFMKLVE
jgi:GTP cyclohydrolase I